MGELSSASRFITKIRPALIAVGGSFKWLTEKIRILLTRVYVWLRLHVPFLEAAVQRHLKNPATIFVDFALLILVLYLAFGATGAILIYAQKSESRFSETLAVLYPLPAVKVDSTYVWSHRYLQRLRFLNTFNQQAPQDGSARPPSDSELREKVMEGLIEDQIILIEARERGIQVTEGELDEAYQNQKKQTDNFESKIQQLYGMSVTDFRTVLAERILKEKVKSGAVTRIKVRHVLTSTESAAKEAKKQIDEGKAFADVAKEFSQDSKTKDIGGELGYWTKGELSAQISQTFEDRAFSLELNKPSDPIQSQYGFHVMMVTEKTGDNFQTFNEWYEGVKAKHRIRRYLDS